MDERPPSEPLAATSGGVAVQADRLGKTYKIYPRPWDRLAEALGSRPRHREFAALSDVSFEVPRGEGFGLVGQNGAGKSTLLKILAGIVAPSAGRVRVEGTVASILELGSAFHPEFTGRQNIALNAAMLGLDEREIAAKTPTIIEFSELGDFIDRPVKTYSTGMAMRLGFAIATQVEPEVLIIDEALSVGDGYFQKKCMDRLERFLGDGGTLLLCSHAMYYVSAFCGRSLWLRHGRPEALGPAAEVVREYEHFLLTKSERAAEAPAADPAAAAEERGGPARLDSVRLLGAADADGCRRLAPGALLELEIEWRTSDPDLAFQLGVGLNRADGIEVASFSSHHDDRPPWRGQRRHRTVLTVPALPLVKGRFALYVYLMDERALHIYDQELLRDAFEVGSPDYTFGLVRIPHRWDDGAAESPSGAEIR